MTNKPCKTNYLFYQSRKNMPFIDYAEGVYMYDTEGKEYLDGCSSAINCNIGHGCTRILQAIAEQSRHTFFAYRTQFENEPAHRLASKLAEISAFGLNRSFFVSSGSEAVEAAIKLVRQYFYNKGERSRYQLISRVPSYHGSTLGALSLTSSAQLEVPYRPMLMTHPKIPAPYCYRCPFNQKKYPACGLKCAWILERVIQEQDPERICAFIFEPVGGASTGAIVAPDEYFEVIQSICKKYGVLIILDEVMTGFGRTGAMFAYEHWNIDADILVMSKGMSSGYYPMGGILVKEAIVEEMLDKGTFAHGHTLAGNPMGCAVTLEVLNVILEEGLVQNTLKMGQILKTGLMKLKKHYDIIGDVRGKGLLMAIELVMDRKTKEPFPPELNVNQILADHAFAGGLIIYPRRPINGLSGDHVMIAPPLTINHREVDKLLALLDKALAQTTIQLGPLSYSGQ
ncbi:MAG: aminotransferase class III-fold pyridoxal phosphate-dependent enzyme [Deltaproteobacteria bacterium]|nr:aminotransferase class III-fold pyridoxal phosphate-dependent enzyme [Deltaproteobacteria bacterium]NCP02661.1 aminotransferase class III-fold pyridoxal phosphate-dependent enzyme [Deltaproteobacteria bacterium]